MAPGSGTTAAERTRPGDRVDSRSGLAAASGRNRVDPRPEQRGIGRLVDDERRRVGERRMTEPGAVAEPSRPGTVREQHRNRVRVEQLRRERRDDLGTSLLVGHVCEHAHRVQEAFDVELRARAAALGLRDRLADQRRHRQREHERRHHRRGDLEAGADDERHRGAGRDRERHAGPLREADVDEREGQDGEERGREPVVVHARDGEQHERRGGDRQLRVPGPTVPGGEQAADAGAACAHGDRENHAAQADAVDGADEQREQARDEEHRTRDARTQRVDVEVAPCQPRLARGNRSGASDPEKHPPPPSSTERPRCSSARGGSTLSPDLPPGGAPCSLRPPAGRSLRSPPVPASDLFSVAGKVALVTGGSRGIGLMIARGFVEAGARVYISSRKAEVCDEVAAELSKVGECVSLPADLATEDACVDLARRVAEREAALHVLVNNAGATWGAPIEEFPASAFDKVLDLNVKAPFFLTRALLPLLQKAATPDDPARVVNIGSIDGIQVPALETYSYSASKAAVHQLTRHLARRLGPMNITVNAVAPGPFESKMMAETLRVAGDAIAKSSPLGRIGRPDDMAGVAIYLASRAGAYVTGAVIPVDGGIATTK
ncbi:MAG: hypothetical protein KatS3mg010_1053 [Acidimicrobiia bacterium]|nr:MAG: hypothetical protein KatS3mg010_1053 [Acidimicrobiia bacterium]